jgi:hypothetical protein
MDWYFKKLSDFGFAQGVGTFVAVRREPFLCIGGFREELLVGEDADLVRRLNSIGHVKYERRVQVHVGPALSGWESISLCNEMCIMVNPSTSWHKS